jgi:hypothetical protein
MVATVWPGEVVVAPIVPEVGVEGANAPVAYRSMTFENPAVVGFFQVTRIEVGVND